MDRSNIVEAIDKDVIFINSLREEKNLSTIRTTYNSVVYCKSGRILVEVGGQQQVRVLPGQLLLIPAGKLVQPMLISTDVEAFALLISDGLLKTALGSQLSIWNRAMYMKEVYVIEEAKWIAGMESYIRDVFYHEPHPQLYREMITSFLRTMLLMLCENLLSHEKMVVAEDSSSVHDKELFNQFLKLLTGQQQKRLGVTFYADKLHVSAKYLSSVAKRVSGKSPMRWITESVMQDCYRLLDESDLTVKEIADRLGFPNSSFFGQYFREEAGITPIEYRNKRKKIG